MAAWAELHRQVSWGASLIILLLVAIADFSAAVLTQLYCSNDNTGSEYWGGIMASAHGTEEHMADGDDM